MNLKSSSKIIIAVISYFSLSTTGLAFTDVYDTNPYKAAIYYNKDQGIIKGYENDLFRPSRSISRAEFVKIIIQAKTGQEPSESAKNCFPDVKSEDWFSSYTCFAKENGIINGFPDGNFYPSKPISLVEAAKITALTFEIPTVDELEASWYVPYLKAMTNKNFIPSSLKYYEEEVKRDEMAEIIYRILQNKSDLPGISFDSIKAMDCQILNENLPENIDMNSVREAWLGWHNAERQRLGLNAYVYNRQLDRTALDWSTVAKQRGYIDHKRAGQTAYYDYAKITKWFSNLGLTFENHGGVTFTESIAWNTFSCKEWEADCTQAAIDTISKAHAFFMSEKGKAYRPHYNAIVKPQFTEIGLGIAISREQGRIYLTVHYDTKINSNPTPICD